MMWDLFRELDPTKVDFKLYQHPSGLRCGWCIGGDHENCLVAVRMGVAKGRGYYAIFQAPHPYVWRCDCPERHPYLVHPASRCVFCLRPGVEVTKETSRCVDREGCRTYRSKYDSFTLPEPPRFSDDEDEDDLEGWTAA